MLARSLWALLGAALYSMIGAAFIQFAAHRVAGVTIRYLGAFKLAFLVYVLAALTSAGVALALEREPWSPVAATVGLAAGVLLGAWVFGTRIGGPRPAPAIGWGRGLVVSLVTWLPAVLVAFALGALLASLRAGTAP